MGGMSSAGMGMQIGGLAQQSATGYMEAGLSTREARRAISKAAGNIQGAYGQAQAQYQPYAQGGLQDYQALRSGVAGGAYDPGEYAGQRDIGAYQEFDPRSVTADPGYAFRQQQGLNAINNAASARGMRLSSATMQALAKYGQNLASEEYGNAYARARNAYEGNRAYDFTRQGANIKTGLGLYENRGNRLQQQYGRQAGLADVGYNAAGNLAQLATGYGSDMANLDLMRGNADVAGLRMAANTSRQQGQGAIDMGGQMQGSGGGGKGGASGVQGGYSLGDIGNYNDNYSANQFYRPRQ